jgi:hypothetical protein
LAVQDFLTQEILTEFFLVASDGPPDFVRVAVKEDPTTRRRALKEIVGVVEESAIHGF